jgi:hypothetical protein
MPHHFQSISTINSKAALAGVCVDSSDGHAPTLSVLLDDFPLVAGRVLLVFCRHADVFHNAARARQLNSCERIAAFLPNLVNPG